MADLKLNTDAVRASANTISKYNKQIKDKMDEVQKAMSKLDAAWDGSAATAAMGKFNQIKNAYADNRYAVVDNYVSFLFQQVGEGYEQTETVNKSLADAFK